MRQQAVSADAGSLVTVGKSLVGIKNWTFLLGPGFMDGIGTGLMLGWLLYRSGLVSRRVALLGVVGGPLLAASGVAVLIGVIQPQSAPQRIATLPEILWEAFLGLWLTFKGFRPVAFGAGETADVQAETRVAVGAERRRLDFLPSKRLARSSASAGLRAAATTLKEFLMIVVDNLTKRYGKKTAVDGLSFAVKPGMVTGFLGPNGSGKSTTMRLILGLHAPTSGSATVNGERYEGTQGTAARCRRPARGTRRPPRTLSATIISSPRRKRRGFLARV